MEKLILIHGAIGSSKEFDAILPLLNAKFDVFLYEIPHHGAKKDSTIPFTIEALATDLLTYIEKLGPAYIYGFSLGGYLALSAAQIDEKNIKGIITQATKFNWSVEEAEKEVTQLDLVFLQNKAKGFYTYLSSLHGAYLPELLAKTAQFMLALGKAPALSAESVSRLALPVRLTRGGRDRMVTKEETLQIKTAIKEANYFEVPHMIHPLGFIKPKFTARLIETQFESFNYKWSPTSFGRMAYRNYGVIRNETEPILLFLHEAIGSIAQWQDFPKNLSKALNLPGIAIEFPGYGFSAEEDKVRDESYLHEFAEDVLPSFLKEIGIKNPLVIIGHSDGGTNALLYSSKYPENVKAIVTMAAHYINEKETTAGIQPAIEAYKEGKLKGLEYFHGTKTERLFYAWANTWHLPGFKVWDISKNIKGNERPALIIQGSNDQYGTDQQVEGIVALLPHSTAHIIENCGHQPHLEKQEEVIKVIKEWWEKGGVSNIHSILPLD